jgi:hypothetical protein
LSGASNSLRFAFAVPGDEADLRRLLRDNPMHGAVRVAFTHEPDYFRTIGIGGAEDRTLTARQDGRLVAAGRSVVLPRWLNGEIRRCAYMGELRLDATARGRAAIIRRGFQFFAADYARHPADLCFTSIIEDNVRALRVLERGLPGLPRYQLIAPLVTVVLPVPGRAAAGRLRARATADLASAGLRVVSGEEFSPSRLVAFLNSIGQTRQFALHWTTDRLSALASHGLGLRDFIVVVRGDTVVAGAALWDQRAFRQIVIDGYAPGLAALRPVANLVATVRGQPRWPAPGTALSQAFLSPLAVADEYRRVLPLVVRAGLATAAERDLRYLSLSLPANSQATLGLRGRRYTSRLYTVHWPGVESTPAWLDARPCQPEIALL